MTRGRAAPAAYPSTPGLYGRTLRLANTAGSLHWSINQPFKRNRRREQAKTRIALRIGQKVGDKPCEANSGSRSHRKTSKGKEISSRLNEVVQRECLCVDKASHSGTSWQSLSHPSTILNSWAPGALIHRATASQSLGKLCRIQGARRLRNEWQIDPSVAGGESVAWPSNVTMSRVLYAAVAFF